MKLCKTISTMAMLLMAFYWVANSATANDLTPRTLSDGSGHTLPYRLFVPSTPTSQKVPLILFFHGAGERGTDNYNQVANNAPLTLLDPASQTPNPCFFVAPQCPGDQQWVNMPWGDALPPAQFPAPTWPMLAAMMVLDSLEREFPNIDLSRLYIVGLSMGGYGTWDAICRWPNRFAAAIPICGGGDSSKVSPLVHFPIWAFHSSDDGTVPVTRSRQMILAIQNRGGSPNYTEFCSNGLPCYNHMVWGAAYAEPGVWPWLFGQTSSPVLKMSDTLVTVQFTIGQARTIQSRVVTAVNHSSVSHLSGAVTVTKKSSWLTVSVNAATPDSQIMTNSIDPSSLADIEQKYYDTVTVHANNAAFQDQSYRVVVWVRASPVLTSITIAPASKALGANQTLQLTATALDQYGISLLVQPNFQWSASAGTISSAGLFTTDACPGSYQVTVSASGVSKSASYTVGSSDIARGATPTISGVEAGSSAAALIDTIVNGYPADGTKEWSSGAKVGAWAQLTWGTPTTIDSITLWDRPNTTDQITAGTLSFSDGSSITVTALPNDATTPWSQKFAAKSVTWVKFTVTAVAANTYSAGLAEFGAFNTAGCTPTSTNAPKGNAKVQNLLRESSGKISIDVPFDSRWTLELYSIAGARLSHYAGTGAADIKFVNSAQAEGSFLIACLRTPSGLITRTIMNRGLANR